MKKPAIVLLFAAGAAWAQPAAQCQASRELDVFQQLRRLSLDLRGRVPDVAEYEALEGQSSIPVDTVRAYLRTDEFRLVMRRYHEDLFWPNISNVSLNNVNAALSSASPPDVFTISSTGRRRIFRGVSDADTTHGRQCGDYEQTHFLPGGTFRPDPAHIRTTVVAGVTVRQEGWRWVTPYWSTTPVKACAYDAQETESVTVGSGPLARTVSCGSYETNSNPTCGCGVGLKFCYGPTGIVRAAITASAREQLGLLVDRVSIGGAPYTSLVKGRTIDVNGPLAFWKANLASNLAFNRPWAVPDPTEPRVAKAFLDERWTEVDRGSDLHAGVLTTAAYLLRFQTNRARANRYRIDFECESYVPPSRLEDPATDGCSADSDDLTQRCTCRGCHRGLEPLAAHWGQFAEAGTTLLSDVATWPRSKPTCVGATNATCVRFYVTNPSAPNPGALLPYQFADAQHPDVADALAEGPRRRVDASLASGAFARCAVKRMFTHLVKREPRVSGANDDERDAFEALVQGYTANGTSLPWLVEHIVSLPQYRRVR